MALWWAGEIVLASELSGISSTSFDTSGWGDSLLWFVASKPLNLGGLYMALTRFLLSLRLNNKPDAMDLYPSLLISGDGCSSLSESAGISRAVGESTVCSISEVAVPCLEGITGVNSCEILKGVELVEVWSSIVLTSLLNACALPSPVFVLSQAGELMECPKGAVLLLYFGFFARDASFHSFWITSLFSNKRRSFCRNIMLDVPGLFLWFWGYLRRCRLYRSKLWFKWMSLTLFWTLFNFFFNWWGDA